MRVTAAVLALLMAGCFSDRPTDATTDSAAPSGTSQTTGPLVSFGGWADPDDAEIRPGAQVIISHLACTANFLYRTPDNRTLYLGVAAHCFGLDPNEAVEVGTTVTIAGIRNAGTVAYNGWQHDDADDNDFGLVRLSNSPAIRAKVSPAMLFYGGPTGLGDSAQVAAGDHVMTYGHSVNRDDDSPDNPREGYVVENDDLLAVITDQPGLPGDSGSGLMLADGTAIGILSTGVVQDTLKVLPVSQRVPTINYYVEVDHALDLAAQADPAFAGLQLVTWEVLNAPDLPTIDPPLAGWQELPVEFL